MLVNNLVTKNKKLVTVKPEDDVISTLELITEKNLLSIPVCKDKKFYGVISKEVIYKYYYDKDIKDKSELKSVKVKDLMRTDIPVASYQDNVEKIAEALEMKNIPFVTVVNQFGEFKGIVTHKAIFHNFTELFGLNKGKKISMVVYNVPGQLSKLSKIISENDGDIISCVVLDPKVPIDVRELVIRIKSNNYDVIVKELEKAGFQIK